MDFAPEETHLALQRMAHEFAEKEIHPAVEEIDREKDPKKRFPVDLLGKANELGLRTLAVPERNGGGGADALTLCFVGEELGWGDLGIGMTLALDWGVSIALSRLCDEKAYAKRIETFVQDESAHLASFRIAPAVKPEDAPPYSLKEERSPVRVTPNRAGWSIDGTVSHVINGEAAKNTLILAEGSENGDRYAFFLDTGGLNAARFHDTMGMRSCQDVDLLFENHAVPADGHMGSGGEWESSVFSFLQLLPCAAALGTARRAHEQALAHAHDRVQGGKPIIQHQTVGFMLLESLAEMNASRRMLQAAAWAASGKGPHGPKDDLLARVFISEACERVARRSMEVWGGAGYMTEAPMERYVRDMMSFMHADEMTHSLRSRAMKML